MRDTRDEIVAYVDGASRGNPGPAAAGFILSDANGTQLQAKAFFLGHTTNNVAEYTGIVKALEAIKQLGAKQLIVYSDSELLIRQLKGEYKVKSEQIRPLFRQAIDLLSEFENWKVQHIAREKNKQADKLVNQALNLERDIEAKPTDDGRGTRDARVHPLSSIVHPFPSIRLGVLISGGGRTMLNILEHIKQAPLEGWYPQNGPLSSPAKRQAFLTGQGKLNAEIAVVISSRSTVAGVERAKKAGLDVKIIRKKDYPDIDEFSKRIEEKLVAANVDLVVQGGWLCLWKIPARYLPRPSDGRGEYRVMNIHPALLPSPVRRQLCAQCDRRDGCTQSPLSNGASFGGQGMWGHYVHEAVLAAGCKVSGCTVHFCTNEYDKGPIILQRSCQVKDDDTPDTLAARVFEQECIAYPQAIKLFAARLGVGAKP